MNECYCSGPMCQQGSDSQAWSGTGIPSTKAPEGQNLVSQAGAHPLSPGWCAAPAKGSRVVAPALSRPGV